MDTDVLIVGAGPVGLTLAIDLGRRGVRCTLIEKKAAPAVPAEDGALQRADDGDLPPHGAGRQDPRRRPAGDVPMDVYVALAMNEPPLLRLQYPSVTEARAADRRVQRRLDAARAVSAHLAVHARAAAEGRGRTAAAASPCATAANSSSLSQDADGVDGHGARRATARRRTSARSTSSAATAARARSAGSSASSCAAKGTCCGCIRRSTTAPTSST